MKVLNGVAQNAQFKEPKTNNDLILYQQVSVSKAS